MIIKIRNIIGRQHNSLFPFIVALFLIAVFSISCSGSIKEGGKESVRESDKDDVRETAQVSNKDIATPTSIGVWQSGTRAAIKEVIDGDTVVLDFEGDIKTTTARLIGINTPEVKSPYTEEQCFGQEASLRLKNLVKQEASVYVLRDEVAYDKYERLLVYIFRAQDGKLINELMLEEGYARYLEILPNNSYRKLLKVAEARAQSQKLGLWGAC